MHDLTTAKGVLYWAASVAKPCKECLAHIERTYERCYKCGDSGLVPEWGWAEEGIAERLAMGQRVLENLPHDVRIAALNASYKK